LNSVDFLQRRERSSRRAQGGGHRVHRPGVKLVLVVVEGHLEPRLGRHERRLDRVDRAPDAAGERALRGARRRSRLARREREDRLGLGQVEAPVEERPAGELARGRRARSARREVEEQPTHERRRAGDPQLDDVLAGEAPRAPKRQRPRWDRRPPREANAPGHVARRDELARLEAPSSERPRLGPREADDREERAPWRRAERDDRVGGVHAR
jgi:hypothetical protein